MEHTVWSNIDETDNDDLEETRMELGFDLGAPILVIGDLQLWWGNTRGCKVIESGRLSDCLYAEQDDEYVKWYIDDHMDLRCTGHHHDGTNQYTYRVFRRSAGEARREWLMDRIRAGKATQQDIDRWTAGIGDRIAQVYGWKGETNVS